MPRGWYLAQGLIPLGESSSDDEEGPCELPNGRLVCGPHGFVTCGKCCSDYSFMDDILGDDEDEDEDEDEYDDVDMDEDEEEDEDDVFDIEIMDMYLNLSSGAKARFRSRYGDPPFVGRPRTQADRSSYQEAPSASGPPPAHMGTCRRLYEDEGDERDIPDPLDSNPYLARRRGTGRVFPTEFTPPSALIRPGELFPRTEARTRPPRYTCRDDPRKLLILTDGACLNNGQPNPKAGWAFVFGPGSGNGPAMASRRLENEGPFGDPGIQTSNRAELRAVIAALRFRAWDGEGFKTIVIATDSEYVTLGSTTWAKTWIEKGWRKGDNTEVKNKDLWEMLLGEVEKWHSMGVSVQFWRIPREWNTVADEAAKKAADEAAIEKWSEILGVMC
ncbi:ribonuclease H-like protein [Nemania abortiva]|nr:ribonuclease H-like protein [Nemania abortiva]